MQAILHPRVEQKEKWRITLERLYSSAKGKIKRLTREQKEKIALEHTPEKARAIMKKYKLEKFRE